GGADDLGHGVELATVPGGTVELGNGVAVVQECFSIPKFSFEGEAVDDVADSIAVVVDVDLIQDVVAKLVEVRTGGGTLQRNVVRDHRDGVGRVRAHEGVGVGAVRDRVLGDLRSLSMRGYLSPHRGLVSDVHQAHGQ